MATTSDANKYNLAVAFLQFKDAYNRLVATLDATEDDVEIGDLYPFYLLDVCTIRPAVEQWCILQANNLLATLPDMVSNPACVNCLHRRKLHQDNKVVKVACGKPADYKCNNHYEIPYQAAVVRPFIERQGYDVSQLTEAELLVLYNQEVTK